MKNMLKSLALAALVASFCLPIDASAGCGTKAKAECAKEAAKAEGKSCCKAKMAASKDCGDKADVKTTSNDAVKPSETVANTDTKQVTPKQ